jgi:SAM-dependent methyltransferase
MPVGALVAICRRAPIPANPQNRWSCSARLSSFRSVTNPPALGNGARLNFTGPLSDERANRLVAELAAQTPTTVIDLGCGWGELLLRILAATPGASGIGIDIHAPDVARGRSNAATRGLSDRATFIEGPAVEHLSTADIVISLGAYQAFGSIPEALDVLRNLVNPGGRLLFGAEFWDQPPTAERLAKMWPGISADDCTDLATLVDQAIAAGFRPLRIETAARGEWEEFESGSAADLEEWLLSHSDHAAADAMRGKLDAQRALWLRGHRDVMGFAYLTLGAASATMLERPAGAPR